MKTIPDSTSPVRRGWTVVICCLLPLALLALLPLTGWKIGSVLYVALLLLCHTAKIVRLSMDLPIVIEIVDAEERVNTLLPALEEMMGSGLVTPRK